MRYLLRFDGAVWPNPGGTPTYGWAVWPDSAAGPPLYHGFGFVFSDEPRTNNVAEWHGLLCGLKMVYAAVEPEPTDELRIEGDSNLVICQLTGKMRSTKPWLTSLRDECQSLLKHKLCCSWSAFWIPRDMNGYTDALSEKAQSLYHRHRVRR